MVEVKSTCILQSRNVTLFDLYRYVIAITIQSVEIHPIFWEMVGIPVRQKNLRWNFSHGTIIFEKQTIDTNTTFSGTYSSWLPPAQLQAFMAKRRVPSACTVSR